MEQRSIYGNKFDVDKELVELANSGLSNTSQQYIREFA